MGVCGQFHAPTALSPRKTRYLLFRRLSRPQDRSGRVRKISPPPGFDPWTVQPVASRYTDCAILAHFLRVKGSRHMKVVRLSAPRTGRTYPPRQYPLYSLLLEAESTPGPECAWKDYVNEKFQWHHRESQIILKLIFGKYDGLDWSVSE